MPLIDHVDWPGLDKLVQHQQRHRSAHAPVISFYRWWARRPHCFAGALLDAARKEFGGERFVVSDPFSGGGTVAFEAIRRGLPVYAQDLYPWPSHGLATALTPADPDEFREAADQLAAWLAGFREAYWHAGKDGHWELTHVIRVRAAACPDCAKRFFLFRDALVSLASRRSGETRAFFGCSACGALSLRQKTAASFRCDRCETRQFSRPAEVRLPRPTVRCPHCQGTTGLAQLLSASLDWHPVLVRELSRDEPGTPARLRPSQTGDPVDDSRARDKHPLRRKIPDGLETGALTRYGFTHWDELYTQRQLDALSAGLQVIAELGTSRAVEEHLRLALLGASEMAGYVCRWERFHPKAIEAIANHRFSRSTVTAETNLLSDSGRGTLSRRFAACEKALRWMKAQGYPTQTKRAASCGRRRPINGALIVTGSSERQLLLEQSVRLVFTDPPYHDDLQYGELARLFHTWMEVAGYDILPMESAEAVPNSARGLTSQHYQDKVAACLLESRRSLARNGRLVLTFHNKNLTAWEALAKALRQSNFLVVGLATVAAENAADHSKRGKQSFLSDLVIECRAGARRASSLTPVIHRGGTSSERKNLEAIGLALADCVNGGGGDLEPLFEGHIKRLEIRKRFIRRGGR